jgi:5'-nucleotidase
VNSNTDTVRLTSLVVISRGTSLWPPHPPTHPPQCDLAAINAASREIKEWQAIMDYLINLPTKKPDGLSLLVKDDRAREIRGIKNREKR